MPTLHVHNVPDTLHARIQQLAETERCSLSAEVITLLGHAVAERENRQRQRQPLGRIRARRAKPGMKLPSSLDMLREDRSR